MLTCSVLLLALLASAQGRAVNISNTWVLPEEGFPVFYRYFRDRISWYEADAVCQFHHANLVTVDTTAQYDAVRAYLKELDISSAVWVGLIRSNPDGDFTWTDYRGLSGDGYWSAAPDARAAPLCAAADPAADYRWEARACGGPTVASFICELPVPQWALGNEGCMVRALPALTILYLPESAAVQLTADCGLAGVKRVQCTGNVKREELLKNLSCNEEDELTSTPNIATEGSSTFSLDLATNATDPETGIDLTTEDDITTKHNIASSLGTTQATPVPITLKEKPQTKQQVIINKFNDMYAQKNINLDLLHNNNLQNNDIPKLANTDNFLTIEQSEKVEDEKHMQHKMLHDELARHGNFETIFTLPTDHFVPPLVMAKARISDDMTVLSLAEKHAQQLAEQQRYVKHNILHDQNEQKSIKVVMNKTEILDKPIVTKMQPPYDKDSLKKDINKSALPKKYKEKHDDLKSMSLKIDNKLFKFENTTQELSTSMGVTIKLPESTTTHSTDTKTTISEDDSLELTVILKEPHMTNTKHFNDIADIKNIAVTTEHVITTENVFTGPTATIKPLNQNDLTIQEFMGLTTKNVPKTASENVTSEAPIKTETIMQDVAMNHEVIKITIIDDNDKSTHTVFEITTLVPEFKDAVKNDNQLRETTLNQAVTTNKNIIAASNKTSYYSSAGTTPQDFVAATETTLNPLTNNNKAETSTSAKLNSMKSLMSTEKVIIATTNSHLNETINNRRHNQVSLATTNIPPSIVKENREHYNVTEMYEVDSDNNATDPDAIDDINSPLLSGASEPLQRPNRLRRPQQPSNAKKFNPFRILG